MPTALQLAQGDPALEAAVRRSHTLLNRRGLVAAAGGFVPVPGVDWAVNAALLSRLIPKINAEFGLDTAQLEQLNPHKREQVQKAVNIVGTVLIGKVLTRELLVAGARHMGVRLTSQQNALDIPGAQWGPMRVVYLHYASDAITFFDPLSFYRAPQWMADPRGPDVSPRLRW